MPVTFCSIASGSSGNCIFVGDDNARILIDAGLSGKSIEKGLSKIGVDGHDLDGIFVTHEHSDHVMGVGILSRRFDIPIYATPRTWRFFQRHSTLGKVADKNVCVIEPGENHPIESITVKAFDIPHDSSQPVGYCIFAGPYKISIATDMGHVTDVIRESISHSDILLLESNHDVEMLKNGRYPRVLKDRVMGKRGHLSNAMAGQLLSEVLSDRLQHIFLGHLSEENNRPLIALDTVRAVLSTRCADDDWDRRIAIAHRDVPSEPVVLA